MIMYCTDLCKSANDFKLAPAACAEFKLHFKLFKWWQKSSAYFRKPEKYIFHLKKTWSHFILGGLNYYVFK